MRGCTTVQPSSAPATLVNCRMLVIPPAMGSLDPIMTRLPSCSQFVSAPTTCEPVAAKSTWTLPTKVRVFEGLLLLNWKPLPGGKAGQFVGTNDRGSEKPVGDWESMLTCAY